MRTLNLKGMSWIMALASRSGTAKGRAGRQEKAQGRGVRHRRRKRDCPPAALTKM